MSKTPKAKVKKGEIPHIGPRKCTVIIVLSDGDVISHKGFYEGKKIQNIAYITATMAIEIPTKKSNPPQSK